MTAITAEELLAGGKLTHEIQVPADLLGTNGQTPVNHHILLRPLTVNDLQRIGKAAVDNEKLSASFMIQHSLVDPELNLEQVAKLPAGLARFLLDQINSISGIDAPQNALDELVQAPLARACFVLAKEFGWTPEEVSGMTIGQILLYLEMLRKGDNAE